jgi:hypothetical protein
MRHVEVTFTCVVAVDSEAPTRLEVAEALMEYIGNGLHGDAENVAEQIKFEVEEEE